MKVVNLNSSLPKTASPSVHMNVNVRGLGTSATLAINEESDALQQAGKTVYRLGLGQSQSPFPVPDSVVASLQENAHQKDYLPVRGLHNAHVYDTGNRPRKPYRSRLTGKSESHDGTARKKTGHQ